MEELIQSMTSTRCWDPVENMSLLEESFKKNLRIFENFSSMNDKELWDALESTRVRYKYYMEQCFFDPLVIRAIDKFNDMWDPPFTEPVVISMMIQALYIDRLIIWMVS